MLRFENRVGLLDLRSDKFLSTLVQIGGYCTIGQAKRLGLANSVLISESLRRTDLCGECSVTRSFTRQPKQPPGCLEKIGGLGAYTTTKRCSIDCWRSI